MDPDPDDPRNPVPAAAPADAWVDRGEASDLPLAGLPPWRADRTIPHGKENRSLPVGHHAADAVGNGPVGDSVVFQSEGSLEERIILPPAHGRRHTRMDEIEAAGQPGVRRIQKMMPKVTPISEGKGSEGIPPPRRRLLRGDQGEWESKAGGGSLRWMLYTGGGVIALVLAAVVLGLFFPGKDNSGAGSRFSQLTPQELDGVKEEDRDMMTMLMEDREEAKRIFADYATAESPADFIRTVYREEEIAGLLERRWEPLGAEHGWKPSRQAVWTVLDHEGLRYGALQGDLPDHTPYRAFFRRERDVLKMDWKATSGYGSSDFGTLKEGRGDGGEIRAWLSLANSRSFPLPGGEFRLFWLASPDRQESILGYTKADGELDMKLTAPFTPNPISGAALSEVAVIVGLERWHSASLPNQWLITKLVRLNWLDE